MQNPLFQTSQPTVYLPEDFIFGLKAALDEKKRLYEALPKEIEDLTKRYEAALNFAPPGFDPEGARIDGHTPEVKPPAAKRADSHPFVLRRGLKPVAPADKPLEKARPPGWRRAVLAVLEKERGGLTHKALIAQAMKEFPHLAASEGDKSYYSAVGKLFETGKAAKHGNLIFLAEALAEAQAKGALPPLLEVGRRSGSSADLIVALLESYPAGLTANDMRGHFRSIPAAPKSLYEHGQYIYGILGPMLGTGEVVKEGELYRLAEKKAEK